MPCNCRRTEASSLWWTTVYSLLPLADTMTACVILNDGAPNCWLTTIPHQVDHLSTTFRVLLTLYEGWNILVVLVGMEATDGEGGSVSWAVHQFSPHFNLWKSLNQPQKNRKQKGSSEQEEVVAVLFLSFYPQRWIHIPNVYEMWPSKHELLFCFCRKRKTLQIGRAKAQPLCIFSTRVFFPRFSEQSAFI